MMEERLAHETRALLRGPAADYYRWADAERVRRMGGFALGVVTALALFLLPFAPPTDAVAPAAGLGLAAALLAGGAAITALCLAGSPVVSINVTLGAAVAAIAGLGTLDALAAADSPYDKLCALVLVWACATHPLRRVALLVLLASASRLPSLAVHGWPATDALESVVQVVVWCALGAITLAWTAGVRAQRAIAHRDNAAALALARVDQLTGLGNRRAFDEAAAAEIARAERTGRPLSLLVADLDAFKAVNDTHGHLAGDDCLRQVAAVVRSLVRRPDTCFRWGGDEFALLLADADLAEARAVGERLDEAVRGGCRVPGGEPLSLGFGAAQFDGDASVDALVARADRALMLAKA